MSFVGTMVVSEQLGVDEDIKLVDDGLAFQQGGMQWGR
jgi:hypothetical protein